MDDGELDSPESREGPGTSSICDYSHFLDNTSLLLSDWDTLMRTTQVCSHKHICNPTTGPDNTHTHTCEHTHTQTIAGGDEEKVTKKKRPSGNKEAVRKYREKQKAVKVSLEVRNAELEKENSKIPELLKENLRLRKKLLEQIPTQAALDQSHSENKRLRSVLLQVKRLVDSELDGMNVRKHSFSVVSSLDACGHGSPHPTSGHYYPNNVTCAAPPPCYAAVPAAQTALAELDHVHDLAWPRDCEQIKSICNTQGKLQPPVESRQSLHGDGSVMSACKPPTLVQTNAESTVRSKKRSASSIPVAYQSNGVTCAAPVPCFNGPRIVNQADLILQEGVESLGWEGGCEVASGNCQDTERTGDSGGQCKALSPEEESGSASTALRNEIAFRTPSTPNQGWVSPEEQMFSPGGYLP